jgi:hypothetical protein
MPTKRRVYAPDGSKQNILNPVLVAIHIRDLAFSADSRCRQNNREETVRNMQPPLVPP